MKNGKVFGIINIIDLLVVVVVLGIIAGIIARFGLTSNNTLGNACTFEYVVKVDNVREYTIQGLERKGSVFAKKTNTEIGEIIDVKVEPCKDDEITFDGNREFFDRPDRYTAYVTIRSNGTEHQGAYFNADKEETGVGRDSNICTRYISTNGITVSLNVIE